jgi:hypothetical protein
VAVANGNRIPSPGKVALQPVRIGGEEFHIDIHALPLGEYDMVLGVQWLSSQFSGTSPTTPWRLFTMADVSSSAAQTRRRLCPQPRSRNTTTRYWRSYRRSSRACSWSPKACRLDAILATAFVSSQALEQWGSGVPLHPYAEGRT